MAKALVITEKPSVARDVADALGGFTEHDGYSESDAYVVTFAVGHLFELLPPEEVDEKYKRWTLDTLPILPTEFRYRPKKGQSERIRTIRKLLARKDVDEVINACDAGREGELIFREIVDHLDSDKPTRRLWLQSMTVGAIRQGFASLRPGEELQGLADAAACRARSDWLIGMNATRAFTKRLKSRKEKTAWSAGRVQTPTLAMLVEREFEVLAHVARPYWRVTGTFEYDGNAYTGGEIARILREILGKGLIVPIPGVIMKMAGLCGDFSAWARGSPSILDSRKAKEATQKGWVCRIDKIKSRLNYSSRIGLKEGFSSTYDWYRSAGWI